MIRYVTYRRVSTREQGRSGLGLKAQDRDIKIYLETYSPEPWEVIEDFLEIQSGSEDDRPELTKAIDLAKRERATLLVAKLDRLSRKVSFIASLMDDKRLNFRVAMMPNADKFQLHIYAALAEQERDFISTRTKAALVEAKAKGKKLGNPDTVSRDAALARGRSVTASKADQFAANVSPIIDQIKASGLTTLQGVADALNARGVKTDRGARWYPATVRNIITREAT